MAGLLARDSSSRRLPGLSASDVNALRPRLQRRVRGGMAPLERHPSSLSSPLRHHDPLFNYHTIDSTNYVAEIPRSRRGVKEECRCESGYPCVLAGFHGIQTLSDVVTI